MDCKSELLKSTWLPQWDIQRRVPAFIGNGPPSSVFNFEGKYRNIPACDILKLPNNEGAAFQSDRDLLFAGSTTGRGPTSKRTNPHALPPRSSESVASFLPLGVSTEAFTVPNPTMFTGSGGWHMMDSAQPSNGWMMSRIRKSRSPAATNDVFGQLYYHIVDLISEVHKRLSPAKVSIQMMQIDANDLSSHFGPSQTRLDRIEASNIVDLAYLNALGVVGQLGPLLKAPSVNPHATLITLFMNAVHDMWSPHVDLKVYENALNQVREYLPVSLPRHPSDAGLMRTMSAAEMFKDFDGIFDRQCAYLSLYPLTQDGALRYKERFGFVPVLYSMGMEMKREHTIIDKWFMRLKKRPGEDRAKEEFQDLLNGQHTGSDRHVEWRLRR
ncbi:hypothetical protein PG994_005272 [Apiospora phragmitis]|uniref:Uncharacterized protein n=1 Tax=Apiospora phragmitis TaxID=2905665 RepID=A0ABR1VX11_9PEZI